MIRLLISHGAEVGKSGGSSANPLRVAAETGHNEVVRTLLKSGADADEYDELGVNVLFWAIISCSESTVKALVDAGVDSRTFISPGFNLLHWFSLYGDEADVDLLLEGDDAKRREQLAAEDFKGSTPLHWAASNMRENVLKVLLDAGSDPSTANNYGITPIHLASAKSGFDHIQLLLDHGADLEARDVMGFTIAHYAALNSSEDILGSFIESGLDVASPDDYGRAPIHIAAEFGCLRSLELLANMPEDLDRQDINGSMVLHAAARHEREECLRYCLEQHTDTTSCNLVGMTPLHCVFDDSALPLPDMSCIPANFDGIRDEYYRRRQRRTSQTKKRGEDKHKVEPRPAASAGRQHDPTVRKNKVRMLLEHGAEVDARDDKGYTALHLACFDGNMAAVQLLLERNADVNARNAENNRPEDTAKTEKIRQILRSEVTRREMLKYA
ncbi:ankyrin repeat-containing domain protein [Thelonectria olida]|uniref:Ankyrin repeat-containing domain protein n=1 Tax=Thelonectria olida TaxID=1576542 RepID=A0A9P8VWT5_9HYPO|nr:ankyrin repeat-containing domain protein [Thelonectria olida]